MVEIKQVLNYSLENVFSQQNILKWLHKHAICASSVI